MPVTVVARAAEPTFRNLRFIDIAGKNVDPILRDTTYEATIRSEPNRSCVPGIPLWKEKTRWYESQLGLAMSAL